MDTHEPYITAVEAAAFLGYAVGTLYNKCAAGEIPHKRLGRTLRFRRSELEAWVNSQDGVTAGTDEAA